MKKSILTLAVLASSLSGAAFAAKGDICTNCPDLAPIQSMDGYTDGNYYLNALTAQGSELATFRSALITDISKNQKQLSYSEVWTALTHTDEDPNNANNLILIYKGVSIPKNHNASTRPPDVTTEEFNNYWNREHVWAKSHGFPNTSQRGYTDIHHLRPADMTINSARGNKGFDEGGVPNSESPENYADTNSWQPLAAVRGDVARMLFYMDVRYDTGTDNTNMPDLVIVDLEETTAETINGIATHSKLCTLVKWNYDDPVDDFERKRNDTIYQYQGNRNPFIDHNEWVDVIYKDKCSGVEVPFNATITDIADTMEGQEITLGVSSDGKSVSYLWEQVEGQTVTIADKTLATVKFTAPDIADTQKETFKFKVTATDADSKVATATVTFFVTDSNYKAPTVDVTIADVTDAIEGNAVSLTASSTTNNVRYNWFQTGGKSVNLIVPYKATVSFTAPQVTGSSVLTFKVTATDANGNVNTQTVSFKVTDRVTPTPDSGESGGSFSIFGVLSLLGLGFLRRKVK